VVPVEDAQPGVLLLSRSASRVAAISARNTRDGREITIFVINANVRARQAMYALNSLRSTMAQILDSVLGTLITGKHRERLIEKWLKEDKNEDETDDSPQ
jgi:ribosomal protein S3AE